MGRSVFSLERQPFKGLYLGLCSLDLFVLRVPWWTIRNLFPSWRPRKSWPISWCIKLGITKYMMNVLSRVGGLGHLPTAKALAAGPGVLGLYVSGVPQYVAGNLKKWAEVSGVSPTRIPGYWLHNPGSSLVMGEKPQQTPALPSKEKILLFFHGGGYAALSAHPDSPSSLIPRSILSHCASASVNVQRSFNVEYRLSSYDPNPRENPFPAALLDALAGYAYLINEVGFEAPDIILVGDSAGGNMALALTRYLIEEDVKLALPGGLILLSPWTDIGNSHKEDPLASFYTNTVCDYLNYSPVRLPDGDIKPDYPMLAFTGPHGVDFAGINSYISPASLYLKDDEMSFKDFPPTFIAGGTAELFIDQIRTLERRMKRDMGDKLRYYEAEDVFHDYTLFEWMEPQRSNTLVEIARWMANL